MSENWHRRLEKRSSGALPEFWDYPDSLDAYFKRRYKALMIYKPEEEFPINDFITKDLFDFYWVRVWIKPQVFTDHCLHTTRLEEAKTLALLFR